MPDSVTYQPVKLKQCPRCDGTGFVTRHKRNSPYEPPGLLICPRCNGGKLVADRLEEDDFV